MWGREDAEGSVGIVLRTRSVLEPHYSSRIFPEMSKRKPTANVHPLLTSGERPKRISQCSLLLSPSPSLGGGFAQKLKIEDRIDEFISVKIQ